MLLRSRSNFSAYNWLAELEYTTIPSQLLFCDFSSRTRLAARSSQLSSASIAEAQNRSPSHRIASLHSQLKPVRPLSLLLVAPPARAHIPLAFSLICSFAPLLALPSLRRAAQLLRARASRARANKAKTYNIQSDAWCRRCRRCSVPTLRCLCCTRSLRSYLRGWALGTFQRSSWYNQNCTETEQLFVAPVFSLSRLFLLFLLFFSRSQRPKNPPLLLILSLASIYSQRENTSYTSLYGCRESRRG